MKTVFHAFAIIVFAGLAAGQAVAGEATVESFYPLIGDWTGTGEYKTSDGDSIALTLTLRCEEAAGGAAVRCDLAGKGEDVAMNESDLMGVDPVTGLAHWYAVSDQGEAHDHLVEWTNAATMKASYSWDEDGEKLDEIIMLTFGDALEFTSNVSTGGKVVETFIGKLTK